MMGEPQNCPVCDMPWDSIEGVRDCIVSDVFSGKFRVTRKAVVIPEPDKPIAQAEIREKPVGTKLDKNKPRWSLLPAGTISQIIAVLEYGATKYLPDNWMRVADHRTRYYNAAMRHVEAWWGGEKNDPESGLPHLAHACCSILFLLWFDSEEK